VSLPLQAWLTCGRGSMGPFAQGDWVDRSSLRGLRERPTPPADSGSSRFHRFHAFLRCAFVLHMQLKHITLVLSTYHSSSLVHLIYSSLTSGQEHRHLSTYWRYHLHRPWSTPDFQRLPILCILRHHQRPAIAGFAVSHRRPHSRRQRRSST
jgi:hypothetical protein